MREFNFGLAKLIFILFLLKTLLIVKHLFQIKDSFEVFSHLMCVQFKWEKNVVFIMVTGIW